ncbi:MAG: CinA family nicotinamide mononucleotide deamidase-related protein [Pedobacter sp.]|nr:MAG: CinA family nicotinamide mononucleotide deamidase-related protein [Pedobacter sp.]
MIAEIITIGDEILIGQIVDTNSAWMGIELNKVGIKVGQITSISDDSTQIQTSLQRALGHADIVLLTGGLGPTKDDVTKKALADFFNAKLVMDRGTLEHVSKIFEKLNRPLLDVNIKQAEVPENCTVIKNENGTAPCMWFEHQGKIIISMPGVPFEMKSLMVEQVIPTLLKHFNLPIIKHLNILTAGLGESFLAKEIEDIEDLLPKHIKLAYLPKFGQVKLRLSGIADDSINLQEEIREWQQKIITRLGKYVIADHDTTVPQVVLDFLTTHSLNFSTAESCTGGFIAHLITALPGSSAVYVGGGVVYTNPLKKCLLGVREETLEKYTAVSEPTVLEMADGAKDKFQSDYAIAVSGYAGSGEDVSEEEIGLIWIAIAGPRRTIAKQFKLGNNRTQNIERASIVALTFLLNELKKDTKIS